MKVSNPSDVRLLDNPIWYALATEQASLAQGNRLAKRFPADVAPFAAMRDQSAAEYQALDEVLAGDAAALFLDTPPALPSAWTMVHSGEMYQMIFDGMPPAEPKQVFRQLTGADVPEMLALTKLTEPGPFLPRTIQLGSYFGVHEHGRLVAMAGERLHITGFNEVSAVCTHPDYRGRGYGNALMSAGDIQDHPPGGDAVSARKNGKRRHPIVRKAGVHRACTTVSGSDQTCPAASYNRE